MKLTIEVEIEPETLAQWLSEIGYGGEDDEPIPNLPDYFRERIQELIDDEIAVATTFGPGYKFTLIGDVT